MGEVSCVFTLNFLTILMLFLPILIIQSSDEIPQRKITMTMKCPNKEKYCPGTGIVEVIAAGKTDEVRYLWSTMGSPSISVAYFSEKKSDKTLTIDWKNLFSKKPSITYKPQPTHSLAMVLSAIYEYNDTDDSVKISKSDFVIKHDLLDVKWDINIDKQNNMTTFLGRNRTINLTMIASHSEGRDALSPHQKFNSNSTRFKVALDRFLLTAPNMTSRRFTFECSFLHPKQTDDNDVFNMYRSLDDEYTPSIFKLFQAVLTKNIGFGQWKPVAYTRDTLDYHTNVHHSLNADIHKNETLTKIDATKSVASAFIPEPYLYAVNVSFGEPEDGFYNTFHGNPKEVGMGYKYLLWSGTVGLGVPPEDNISTTVLIIIIAGLGTPALVLITGGVYLCIKKYKDGKNTSYSRIN